MKNITFKSNLHVNKIHYRFLRLKSYSIIVLLNITIFLNNISIKKKSDFYKKGVLTTSNKLNSVWNKERKIFKKLKKCNF